MLAAAVPPHNWRQRCLACRAAAGSRQLSVDVTWQDKAPTRLPEALWLRWVPRPAAGAALHAMLSK